MTRHAESYFGHHVELALTLNLSLKLVSISPSTTLCGYVPTQLSLLQTNSYLDDIFMPGN